MGPEATPRQRSGDTASSGPVAGAGGGGSAEDAASGKGHEAKAALAGDTPPSKAARAAPGVGNPSHGATGQAATDDDRPLGRLVLIGTGHVFRIDAAIRGAIHALRPDVVFVELDQGRLDALLHRQRTGSSPARGGFVHSRLQRFQEQVAQMYGAQVGNEMLAAVQAAREVGARLGLIDAPGEQTIKRALRSLTVRERLRAVGQLVAAGFKRLLPRGKAGNEAMEAEIKRYQDDPDAALNELRRQYPTVWRVLIDERDERMAGAIRQALAGARLGVAVLGDGHVPGVLRRMGGIDVEVYRLADVREDRLPRPEGVASGTSERVSFGFDLQVDALPESV